MRSLLSQLLDHAVEGGGELADFVLRRHVDGLIETPGFHLARTLQQLPHRPRDAAGDQQRKGPTEGCGKRRHHGRNHDRLALIAYHGRGAGQNLRHHLGADRLELADELVAQRVDVLQNGASLVELASVERLHQFGIFGGKLKAQICDGNLDPGLDARQCRIVRRGRRIGNDLVDQLSRRTGFALDLAVLGQERLQPRLVARLVRRGLHLRNHHSPQRQRAFERTDIGAREVGVGGDIAIGELVQEVADLRRHHDRQRRGDDHQDDQAQRNADDLAADRLAEHRERFDDAADGPRRAG